MPTGTKKGLNPARKVGSNVDNAALSAYSIASGYATALGVGDPVKLTTDGTIIKATNGADAIGSFAGVQYKNSLGEIKFGRYWPASTVGTEIVAYVYEDPNASFRILANGPIPASTVFAGNIYALDVATAADAFTGRSQAVVNVIPTRTGSLAVTGTNNAALTGLANNDTFQIRSTVANVNTTITIVTNQTPAQLLALLNAVPGITASLNGSNFLVVSTTDGGNIVLTDGTGTPLTDSNLIGTAGTVTAVVAANAGLVKVLRVIDRDAPNYELEVVIVNHSLRDDG